MRRAILWVVPKWPLPAHDGARKATVDLLRSAASEFDVDLLSLAANHEACDREQAVSLLGLRSAHVVRRGRVAEAPFKNALFARNLLTMSRTPLSMEPFVTGTARAGLRAFFESRREQRWFATVFDGLHGAMPWLGSDLEDVVDRMGTWVYRAHNVEADLWIQASERARYSAMRWLFRSQARKVHAIETELLRRSGAVLPVSLEDLERFRASSPETPGSWVPIGVDFEREPVLPVESATIDLLFVGRLDWPPNRDGLKWFLRDVWPVALARRPELRLTIIGSGSAEGILGDGPNDRVRFLGRVEDLAPYYQEASVALVPIHFGSGTRVKAIEAAQFARACLSTAIGVQGLGLEPGSSYVLAETAEEWIQALATTSKLTWLELGRSARLRMMARFDSRKVSKLLMESLSVLSRPGIINQKRQLS